MTGTTENSKKEIDNSKEKEREDAMRKREGNDRYSHGDKGENENRRSQGNKGDSDWDAENRKNNRENRGNKE